MLATSAVSLSKFCNCCCVTWLNCLPVCMSELGKKVYTQATLNVKNVPVRLGNVHPPLYRCHQKMA